jgi:hypothetical protein
MEEIKYAIAGISLSLDTSVKMTADCLIRLNNDTALIKSVTYSSIRRNYPTIEFEPIMADAITDDLGTPAYNALSRQRRQNTSISKLDKLIKTTIAQSLSNTDDILPHIGSSTMEKMLTYIKKGIDIDEQQLVKEGKAAFHENSKNNVFGYKPVRIKIAESGTFLIVERWGTFDDQKMLEQRGLFNEKYPEHLRVKLYEDGKEIKNPYAAHIQK